MDVWSSMAMLVDEVDVRIVAKDDELFSRLFTRKLELKFGPAVIL